LWGQWPFSTPPQDANVLHTAILFEVIAPADDKTKAGIAGETTEKRVGSSVHRRLTAEELKDFLKRANK